MYLPSFLSYNLSRYSNNFPAMSLLVNLSHSVSFKLHIAFDDRVVGSLLKSNEQLGCTICDTPDILYCIWYIIV